SGRPPCGGRGGGVDGGVGRRRGSGGPGGCWFIEWIPHAVGNAVRPGGGFGVSAVSIDRLA
ncbi:hypothetical protein, partial [Amycolatopsis orientalis]|uniref:hypothetical protein n=1 Tax=Amycolatopsis orientalis TaxID=31958 RepID=UPI001F39CAE1